MTANELYNLELGESVECGADFFIRVPGGWVIESYSDVGMALCFIPFDNEFQPVQKNDNT